MDLTSLQFACKRGPSMVTNLFTCNAQAVKAAAVAGARQIIVSDANTVFIDELLAAHGLQVGLLDPGQEAPTLQLVSCRTSEATTDVNYVYMIMSTVCTCLTKCAAPLNIVAGLHRCGAHQPSGI